MKAIRRAILTVPFLFTVSFSQTPTPTPVPSPAPSVAESQHELAVRMMPMGVAMLLATILETEPPEEVKMTLAVIGDYLPPALAEEDARLVEIAYATRQDQIRLAGEVLIGLRKRLSDSEKWTVDIGQAWGKTYGKAIVLGTSGFKTDSAPFLDSLKSLGSEVEKNRRSIPDPVLVRLQAICGVMPKDESASIGAVVGSFFSETLKLIDYLDSIEKPVRRPDADEESTTLGRNRGGGDARRSGLRRSFRPFERKSVSILSSVRNDVHRLSRLRTHKGVPCLPSRRHSQGSRLQHPVSICRSCAGFRLSFVDSTGNPGPRTELSGIGCEDDLDDFLRGHALRGAAEPAGVSFYGVVSVRTVDGRR